MAFLLEILFFELLSCLQYFRHGLIFLQMVLQMRTTVKFNQLTGICKMVASACHHLCKFCEQVTLPGYFYHFVEFWDLIEGLAETIHSIRKFCTLVVDFLVNINDLLVENLVALSKRLHLATKDCAILLDLNINLSIKSKKLSKILLNLYFFVFIERFLPIFWVNDSEEVNHKTTCFQILASTDCLQESLKLLLPSVKNFVHQLCIL